MAYMFETLVKDNFHTVEIIIEKHVVNEEEENSHLKRIPYLQEPLK